MACEHMTEAKFKVGDQWFYRGNRSLSWLFLGSRPDGSAHGIAELVPVAWWPMLEKIADLLATQAKLPDELYDGMAVYVALGIESNIRPMQVAAVLDAVVKLIRKNQRERSDISREGQKP